MWLLHEVACCMVYTERAEMAAVSYGASHASTKYNAPVDIEKWAIES